eukprot:Clim_evm109s149 gene=Clim_evmTU109s149
MLVARVSTVLAKRTSLVQQPSTVYKTARQFSSSRNNGFDSLPNSGARLWIGAAVAYGCTWLTPSNFVNAEAELPIASVYIWGSNQNLTVPGESAKQFARPTAIPFFDKTKGIAQIAFGEKHAAAVGNNRIVYGWGRAYEKEGGKDVESSEPRPILKGCRVKALKCTREHVIILDTSGYVYTLPVNEESKSYTTGYFSNSHIPQKQVPSKYGAAIDMSAGENHIVVVTSKGYTLTAAVTFTGDEKRDNRFGQLGRSYPTDDKELEQQKNCFMPVDLRDQDKACAVACGARHSIIRTERGEAFSWGSDEWGQLALGNDLGAKPVIKTPTKLRRIAVEGEKVDEVKVTRVAAGGDVTGLVIEGRKGFQELQMAGFGLNGALGTGLWTHGQARPIRVKVLAQLRMYSEALRTQITQPITQVSIGLNHVMAAVDTSLEDNDIYIWGHNLYAQLGNGKIGNVASAQVALGTPRNRGYLQLPDWDEQTRCQADYNNCAIWH